MTLYVNSTQQKERPACCLLLAAHNILEGLSGSDRTDYLAQVKEVVPQLRFD